MPTFKPLKCLLPGILFAFSSGSVVQAQFSIGQVPSQLTTGRAFNISYNGGTPGQFTQAEYRIGTNPNWTAMSRPTPSVVQGGVVTAIPPLGLTSPAGQFFIRITQRVCQAGICGGATATSSSTSSSTLSTSTLPCQPSMANARAWLRSVQFLSGTASLMSRTDDGPTTSSYADYSGSNRVNVPRLSGTSPWPSLTLRINAGLSTSASPLPLRSETRIAVWLDRNNNKIFESSELISTTTPSYALPSTATTPLSITLPSSLFTSTWSNTSVYLRIRLVGDLPTTSSGISTFNSQISASGGACAVSFSGKSGATTKVGETEDYTLFFPAASSSGREAVSELSTDAPLQSENSQLLVYPNPVRAGLFLEIRNQEKAGESETNHSFPILRDLAGKEWQLMPAQENQYRIPADCRPGLYFLSGSGIHRPLRICITN